MLCVAAGDEDDDGNAIAIDPRSPAVLATINACRTKQQIENLRAGMSADDQELYRNDLAAAWTRLPRGKELLSRKEA